MSTWYKLVDRMPVPCSLKEWGAWMAAVGDRRVAYTDTNGITISTVFLGVDHRHFGQGRPVLFETMIFGGEHDGWQNRACTWDEAEAMHAHAVALVQGRESDW